MFTPICVAGHTLKHLREYYADSKKEKNVQDIKGNIIKNIFLWALHKQIHNLQFLKVSLHSCSGWFPLNVQKIKSIVQTWTAGVLGSSDPASYK